jgi:threonine dehydratase
MPSSTNSTATTPGTASPVKPAAPPSAAPEAVAFADLEAARARLAGVAVTTPLLEAPELSEALGARVLLKCETLQRTGSFKFRGAYNRIATLAPEARARGIAAFSSGNHAQGVAAAAAMFDAPATIVMPADAPEIKVAKTKGYGAEVILYDRYREDRDRIAADLVERRGMTLVKPFDDPFVVAGQGTCGLEILAQAAALGARLDRVLVCCGGGGLSAGIALALEAKSPATRLYTVEPEGFDDWARSLAAGERLSNAPGARSICDALLSERPGELTFPIVAPRAAGGLAVTDAEVERAMAYAVRRLKLVVEPGGAVCLAALLSGKADLAPGETVAVTLSGGNLDPARLQTALVRFPEA